MGKIRKILETELVGGTQSTDVYPVTSTKAVYDTDNKVLDNYIQHLKKTSTFAGIATPTTNPGTPDGPVFYIAGEGTYVNFSNLVIGVGQLGILKWDGTWSKQVLEIGAGGGSGSGSGVSLGTLLTKLNSDNPFPTDNGQVLTYDGTNFIWKTPTSGSGGSLNSLEVLNKDGSTFFNYNGETAYRLRFGNGLSMSLDGDEYVVKAMGGTANLSEYSWWGRKFDHASNSITGEMSSVTSIEFQLTNGETIIKKKLHLDNNGDLCFDGNFYATGGITAFGSSGNISGGGSNGGTTGILYFGAPNKNLGFNGSKDMSLAFGDGLKVEKLDNQITVSAIGGGTGSGVTLSPTMNAINNQLGETTSNTPQFLYWDGSTYTWKNESEISGGSGSSSRIKYITLFNSRGSSFETIDLGTADTIGFMAGNNVSLEAVVKEYTNVIKISATGGSGGSSGSTSTSVSWEDVTNKPSTFTPSSHTHLASAITNFESTVKGIKVDDASHADSANKLASSVYLWGNSFNGVRNIGSAASNTADLRYVNNIYTGNTFGLYNTVNGIDTSLLSIDNTPNISVAYGYRSNENAILSLFGNKTKIYTNGQNYHFDFVRNVFDVNSNQIHFGSETNGGKISWDAANNAFKIEGNVYATGGITALGVSNNATTSNNVDFTFKSVTADSATFDKLYLRKEYGYGLFVGTKCALWGAIETDAIHIGGNFSQVYMTELVVINSNSKQCYFATRIQSAKGLSLLDGYLDVTYNGTTYKFDFAKAKELGLLINAGVKTLSDEVDYANIIQ